MYEYLRIYEYEYVEFLVPSHDYTASIGVRICTQKKNLK